MNINPIPKSDDFVFSYLMKKMFVDPAKPNDDSFTVLLLGIILAVGTEPYKLLLRRKIGKCAIGWERLVIASLFFIIWGLFMFFMSSKTSIYSNDSDFMLIFTITGIFYEFFALLTLFVGLSRYFKAVAAYNKENPDDPNNIYRGDSIFFGYLKRKGWSNSKIWLRADGLFCLSVSLVITLVPFVFFDPWFILLGIPLFITSLSFLFNEWFQIKNVWGVVSKKLLLERKKWADNQDDSEFYPAAAGN